MKNKRVIVISCAEHVGQLTGRVHHKTVSSLHDLQQAIGGGNIQLIPHMKGDRAPLTSYVDEEGLLKGLSQNSLAALVLDKLGFYLCPPTMTFYGPVVIMGKNDQGLKDAQVQLIEKTVQDVIDDFGSLSSGEDNEEEPEHKKQK